MTKMSPVYNLFLGTFIHLPREAADGKHVLEINRGALWVSTSDGRIKGFHWETRDDSGFRELMEKMKWIEDDGKGCPSAGMTKVKVIRAREDRNEFFFPGFIDTHIHAPQYPNCGLFGSSSLLDWLDTYTFPLEKSFGVTKTGTLSPNTILIYDQVVARTLSHGTTCAAYFATIHVPATNYLSSACHQRGQRAFIGRVCMDREKTCPNDYRDSSSEECVAATKATISYMHKIDPDGDLVNPIITPRFAPSSTSQALVDLGVLAASHDPPFRIQTHISENQNELDLVKELYPSAENYTDVYDKANLLTPRTILAHGVYLSPSERAVIRTRQSKVSHCPASNCALGSGLCPVRALLDSGITVGLGTDVSGGWHPSILEAVRQAYLVSRLLRHTKTGEQNGCSPEGREIIGVEEGLYLATRGGAAVVDMPDDIGGFDLGMFFDAQLIQLGSLHTSPPPSSSNQRISKCHSRTGPVSNVNIFDWESWPEKVQKWVWNGDDRNVKMVWVRGRLVHVRDSEDMKY